MKLNCIEGQEFAGGVANSQKEAEALASQQILDFYAEQINNMRKLLSFPLPSCILALLHHFFPSFLLAPPGHYFSPSSLLSSFLSPPSSSSFRSHNLGSSTIWAARR